MYSADMAALKTRIGTVVSSINTAYTAAKLLMTDEQKAAVEAVLSDLAQVEAKAGEIMEGALRSPRLMLLLPRPRRRLRKFSRM